MNNINSKDSKFSCTGCAACAIVCSRSAISFSINNNGFYQPIIDDDKCVGCGLCKKVCYKFFNEQLIEQPYKDSRIYAVINNYSEQMSSVSTVGVSTALAKLFFLKRKKVVGVSFDPNRNYCYHKVAETIDDITSFKGSKYLQSQCFSAFNSVIKNSEPSVVFGTPCQIYGLRKVLSVLQGNNDLLLVDLFCVGVPTINLWKCYKSFLNSNFNIGEINSVFFRDKTQGWHKFSVRITDVQGNVYIQNLYNDLFFKFFLQKKCMNKSCYNCIFRQKFIASDIRLGDFWGAKYQKFDDGVQLMSINTQKGNEAWNEISHLFRYEECCTQDISTSQKIRDITLPNDYDYILDYLNSNKKLEQLL